MDSCGGSSGQRAKGGGGQRASESAGGRVAAGGGGVYGREEVSALKGIFNLYDAENTGTIAVKELEGILQKVGHSPGAYYTINNSHQMEATLHVNSCDQCMLYTVK